MGRPLSLGHVDAVRLAEELATDFAEYRRWGLPFWTDPTPAPVPEEVKGRVSDLRSCNRSTL